MRSFSIAALTALTAAALVACGGGGGGGSSPVPGPAGGGTPPPGPVSTPAPGPSATFASSTFSASNAIAVPTAAPAANTISVPLPTDYVSGAAGAVALPASASVPADTTIDATLANTADASFPPLALRRTTLSRTVSDETKPWAAIAYLRLEFSADVTLPIAPGFTFSLPGVQPISGVTHWLALYDPLRPSAGWQLGWEGPGVATATTVNGKAGTQFTFPSNGKPITFAGNHTYGIALVALGATAPSPTPVPSSVPTRTPEPKPSPVTASPSALVFPTVSSSPQAVTFAQAGFGGPFILRGDCTGILNSGGASPTFTLTPIASGKCAIVGIGQRGASAVVRVAVAVTPEPTHSPKPPSPSPSAVPSGSPSPQPSGSASPSATNGSPEPQRSASPLPAASASPTASPSPGASQH